MVSVQLVDRVRSQNCFAWVHGSRIWPLNREIEFIPRIPFISLSGDLWMMPHECLTPVLGQHSVIASVAYVYFFPECRQGISPLASQTCNTIYLPLMAWLICSGRVYTDHVHFFLSSSSFATLRSILVLHCWMDSLGFLGKKCTAFSSSLLSYALKFMPRWHTGRSELRSSVRALMESFGTKCCKASLLMLSPCKHTPANPELPCTENQVYVGQGGRKDKLWKQVSAIKVHNPAWGLTGRSGNAIYMN